MAAAAAAIIAFGALGLRILARVTVERPAVGGVLREGAIGEPRFVNPIYATNDTDRDLANLVFAKLIRYDASGAPMMDLAEYIELGADDRSYTIRLREELEWHDGEALDADDVVFTVKTVQDPAYQSPFRQNWQGVAVEKLDGRTVRFSLRQPYAPFIENLAVGILPEHLWRKIPAEAAALSDLNLKPVGAGPYRFEKFTRREEGRVTSVALVRNKRYHLEGPYLKEVRFSFFPSQAELVAAYRRNEIDAFTLLSAAPDGLERLDLELHELALPKLFAVFLNATADPVLGRGAVRNALNRAVDRDRIIRETAADGGRLAPSPLPPGILGFHEGLAPVSYDPEAARRILADDGWKDGDGDGVLERTERRGTKRTTQTLAVTLHTSDAPELARAAELIAELWRAVGVKTDVVVLAVKELEANVIRPRAYEALLFGEVLGHDPDPFAFWHTSQLKDPGLNIALYSNRRVDELLEEARRTHDTERRRRLYREFQELVSREVGAIFLYSPSQAYAVRKNIRGVEIGAIALPDERFNGINRWHVDTRRAFK